MSTRPAPRILNALILPIISTAAVALMSADAVAQDALGDGGALDANPRVGSGGRNMPRIMEDFRARNRIVTGEVAGGREFRGDIDYVGERAFAAPLPSDEFFRFESSAAATTIQNVLSGRSVDRFDLALGGGVFAFDRDFTAPTAGRTAVYGERFFVPERAGLDAMTRATTTGRLLERSSTASLIGAVYDPAGDALSVVGSPIIGLRFEQAVDGQLPAVDLPLMDLRAVAAEFLGDVPGAQPPGEVFRSPLAVMPELAMADTRLQERREASLRQAMVLDPTVDRLSGDPDYDAIVRRVVEEYGIDPTVVIAGDRQLMDRLQRQLDELRGVLERQMEVPDDIMSVADRLAAEMDAEAAERDAEWDPERDVDPDAEPEADPTPTVLDERLLRALRHGQTVEDLAPVEQTRLAQMLARGEQLLSEGQFMLAERYFDRALRFMPRHPMALAGLVNTQIGAGLYLSAAVNLHQLLAAHPEMIDVRYGRRILPPEGRLEIAVEALRGRIARASGADLDDYGLLLAYIGHQTHDRDLVLDGLAAMLRANERSTLVRVLEAIWLGE